jgi:hypothetical protein
MLILFTNSLKMKQIKAIAKINKIKMSRKNKKILLYEINYIKKVIFIQRNLRKTLMKTDICPITLMPLKYPFVSLVTSSGHFCYYQLYEFSMYIIKSKKWENPITREVIPNNKMKEISDLSKYYHKRPIIKNVRTINTNVRTTDTNLILLGRSIIEYVETLMNYEELTLEHINTVILPFLMTSMFYINREAPGYLLMLVCAAINKLLAHECSNKFILIDAIRRLVASE